MCDCCNGGVVDHLVSCIIKTFDDQNQARERHKRSRQAQTRNLPQKLDALVVLVGAGDEGDEPVKELLRFRVLG